MLKNTSVIKDTFISNSLIRCCYDCGTYALNNDKFYVLCGSSLTNTCPKCLEIVHHKIAFYCPNCGINFEEKKV